MRRRAARAPRPERAPDQLRRRLPLAKAKRAPPPAFGEDQESRAAGAGDLLLRQRRHGARIATASSSYSAPSPTTGRALRDGGQNTRRYHALGARNPRVADCGYSGVSSRCGCRRALLTASVRIARGGAEPVRDGPQLQPAAGQPKLVAPRTVRAALDQPVLDKARQSHAEDGARDVEMRLQRAEAPHPEEQVAQDQHRPAFTDDLERPRQGTILAFVLTAEGHAA